jgi:hypothetical protein
MTKSDLRKKVLRIVSSDLISRVPERTQKDWKPQEIRCSVALEVQARPLVPDYFRG